MTRSLPIIIKRSTCWLSPPTLRKSQAASAISNPSFLDPRVPSLPPTFPLADSVFAPGLPPWSVRPRRLVLAVLILVKRGLRGVSRTDVDDERIRRPFSDDTEVSDLK